MSSSTIITAELKTITDFTREQHALPQNKQREIFLEIDKVFTEQAYNVYASPVISLSEHVGSFDTDAQILERVAKQLGLGEQTVHRLIANVIKVCRISTNRWIKPPVFECRVYDKNAHDAPLCSGWLDGKYVENSEALKQRLKNGMVVFNKAEVEPFTLLAIQNFQEALEKLEKGKEGTDLPYNMFIEAVLFAKRWYCPLMQDDLQKIMKAWGGIPSPSRQQEYNRVVELYGSDETLHAISFISIISGKQNKQEISLFENSVDEDSGPSRFDAENPIESILKFTACCCALPADEQRRFIAATRKFFVERLNERGSIEIPIKYENAFSLLSLPLLMKTMQVSAEERRRFLAAVQNVTNRSFPQLCTADQVQLVYPRIAKADGSHPSLAWIPGKANEKKHPIAPLHPLSASEASVKTLANLTQAAPAELIASLYFAMNNEWDRLTNEIETLIDTRLNDLSTRGQFTEVLARELHHQKISEIADKNTLQFDLDLVKQLNEEEFFNLFLYITGIKVGHSSVCVKEVSLHFQKDALEILELFIERCEHSADSLKYKDYIKAVRKYAKNRLLNGISSFNRSSYAQLARRTEGSPFKDVTSQLFKTNKNKNDILVIQSYFSSSTEEQTDEIYQYLKDPETRILAKLAECESAREVIVEQIELTRPEIKSTELMNELVGKSFPELQGHKNDPLYKALNATMKRAINRHYAVLGDFSRAFPLSKDQVRKTKDVLAHSGSDPHFVNTFRTLYNVDKIEFEDQIREELALVRSQDPSIPQNALAFIEALSLGNGKEGLIKTLAIEHATGLEESAAVCHLLTLNDVISSAFKSHMGLSHQLAVKSMARFPDAVALSKEFMETFKLPLPTLTRSERILCETLFEKIFQIVYRKESMIDSRLIGQLYESGSDLAERAFSEDFVIQACLLLSQDDVQQWFEKKETGLMQEILMKVFKNEVKAFSREMEIKLFMSLVKAKNRLSDQAFECLDRIFDVMHEVKQDRIIHRLRTNTTISTLTDEDIQAIKLTLDDGRLTKTLTFEGMPDQIKRLRSALDDVKAAPKSHASSLKMLTQ